MNHFFSCGSWTYLAMVCLVCLLAGKNTLGQTDSLHRKATRDSFFFGIPRPPLFAGDPLHSGDSSSMKFMVQQERKAMQKKLLSFSQDSLGRWAHGIFPGKTNNTRAPFLRFTGGYASYIFNYRSVLDTPYTEKNLAQHQVVSTLNILAGGMIPLRVNTFLRRSNVSIFRDINDVQVLFDAAAYRNNLAAALRERVLKDAPGPDSMAAKMYALKKNQADKLGNWLKDPLTHQKLIEANEIVKVPHITYDMQLPDSTNKKREDSLRVLARTFLELYAATKKEYETLSGKADTLKQLYDRSLEIERKVRQLSGGGFNSPSSYETWKGQLQEYTPGAGELPAKYRWLLGVRNFGLGRNTVNSSELTAKNLSLKGINFEYNSWYYLGVTAGVVDYRFRDFALGRLKQPPQYMYLFRAGLGHLEKNYFILSAFGGQKQLYETANTATIKVTGLGAQTKWQLERTTYLIAEAAQSFSPDMQNGSIAPKPGWSFSDKSNKALSLRLYSWIPSTASRLEAQYKFTGANFQSFNSFQTNSELRSWYVKGEQNLFRRQLKLVASLRSNDFSNPYIVQNYKANTVFKSFSATFHKRNLPTISIGYMPMSQLTMVGSQLEESRFQTLTASISHFYRLGQRRASTNIVYTKFINNSSDTGFIYYNSVNLYAGQTIFFRDFTATLALSHSRSPGYQYNVVEGNVNLPLTKMASLGLGAKLNDLDQRQTGIGAFINTNILIAQRDRLYVNVEKGFLPGSGTAAKLVPNVVGTISYMKVFR